MGRIHSWLPAALPATPDVHRAYELPLFGQSFLGQFLFFKIQKKAAAAQERSL